MRDSGLEDVPVSPSRDAFLCLAPILPAVLIFGVSFGAAGLSQDHSTWFLIAMSAIIFAGAAQFAAIDILAEQGSLIAVAVIVLATNARHIALGATLAGRMQGVSWLEKAAGATVLSDANWAASAASTFCGRDLMLHLFIGGFLLWAIWVSGTALGALGGVDSSHIQASGLDSLIPAFFLTLLLGSGIPNRTNGISILSSVSCAAALSVTGVLDWSWMILIGAIFGTLVGWRRA